MVVIHGHLLSRSITIRPIVINSFRVWILIKPMGIYILFSTIEEPTPTIKQMCIWQYQQMAAQISPMLKSVNLLFLLNRECFLEILIV